MQCIIQELGMHHRCWLAAPGDLLEPSPASLSRNPAQSSRTTRLSVRSQMCSGWPTPPTSSDKEGVALPQWSSWGHWAATWWRSTNEKYKISPLGLQAPAPTSSPTAPRTAWGRLPVGGCGRRTCGACALEVHDITLQAPRSTSSSQPRRAQPLRQHTDRQSQLVGPATSLDPVSRTSGIIATVS